jgi:3-oxosteroid 1-dehydrogenase
MESVPVPAEVDVVVVGSGAGALVAACRAADGGAQVAVLEAAPVLGGSTAVSGGIVWVPNNHLMAAAGLPDSAEAARTYLAGSPVPVAPERIDWFVDTAPTAVRYLTDETHVNMRPLVRPDYLSWLPGATAGRSLDQDPFEVRRHDGLEDLLRKPNYFPSMTLAERDSWLGGEPDTALMERRGAEGIRTLGGALAGALVASAADRGVTFHVRARARGLLRADGVVGGVRVETPDGPVTVRARRGVVLASGGFEWNPELQQSFLPGPVVPVSPPYNRGDGLLMGLEAGAAVRDMAASWGHPVLQDPAHEYDGRPGAYAATTQLTLPGSILVNRHGERFANEASGYHILNKAFLARDTADGSWRNRPAWLVFDQRYRRSYELFREPPGETAPPWVTRADSLAALADRCSIDAAGLEATVTGFNEAAVDGHDPVFRRGESVHDRHLGDAAHEPSPVLAPLAEAPFYAVPIRPGTIGTLGGLLTDLDGRVLDHADRPIAGLFAAGNVSAGVFGDHYPGAGATIGAAVVRGYAAGAAAAQGTAR